jgi:hypothetical protein
MVAPHSVRTAGRGTGVGMMDSRRLDEMGDQAPGVVLRLAREEAPRWRRPLVDRGASVRS